MEDLKYGTKVFVFVIKGEAPPEDWWGEAPERLRAFPETFDGCRTCI
jgi:hypothetical protein